MKKLHSLQDLHIDYEDNSRKYQDEIFLNYKQRRLIKLALYGSDILSSEELKHLSFPETLVLSKTNKARRLINRWKQQVTERSVDEFLLRLFPKSKAIIHICKEKTNYTTDREYNSLTFKELGITQEMLVNKLISWNILPDNFYNITI